jgi:RimJ/RimL family protein N-acetyltransferase
MQLVQPSAQFLPGYILALERGWSADTVRGAVAAAEELGQIRSAPAGFLASLEDQPGTHELPPHCLGHIGFTVVPWKRRRGYATAALRLMLPEARAVGLKFAELTTDPDNVASQRAISRYRVPTG